MDPDGWARVLAWCLKKTPVEVIEHEGDEGRYILLLMPLPFTEPLTPEDREFLKGTVGFIVLDSDFPEVRAYRFGDFYFGLEDLWDDRARIRDGLPPWDFGDPF